MARLKPHPEALMTLLRKSWQGDPAALDRVWSGCLREMVILYYPPAEADNDAGLLDYCETAIGGYLEDLAEFSSDVIREGWKAVRRKHAKSSWPLPSALRSACQEERAISAPSFPTEKPTAGFGGSSRFDREADACMRHPFGQKAIREGWGWDLYCWVRDRGDWPKGGEIDRLKGAPLRAAHAFGELPESNPFRATLEGLWKAIQGKNDWLRGKYLTQQQHSEVA
jgi:hypothetical protein